VCGLCVVVLDFVNGPSRFLFWLCHDVTHKIQKEKSSTDPEKKNIFVRRGSRGPIAESVVKNNQTSEPYRESREYTGWKSYTIAFVIDDSSISLDFFLLFLNLFLNLFIYLFIHCRLGVYAMLFGGGSGCYMMWGRLIGLYNYF
jgi:hypothetical protein